MSTVEESIIETQRKIIGIQDELNATNDSIIALMKKENAIQSEELECLTNSNNLLIVMNNRLQLELRAMKEELDVCGDDLSSYMRQRNDLAMVEDMDDTTEYLREQD